MTSAIRTVDLHKTYASPAGDVHAVNGITLEVQEGEFFGLLGPNGAGKSTAIGMLTTRIIPSSGEAYVGGIDVVKNPAQAKRQLGVVTQTNTLDRSLTVAENLEFHGRFFGLSVRESRALARDLLERFQLDDKADAMAADLSGGMAQRLMIARALAHRPYVLFLDEPTSGIDPQSRINLWETLRDLHKEGQSILLTTHYMEEADALCERVAIIDEGKVLADDSPAELKRAIGADTIITIVFDADASKLVEQVRAIDGVRKVEHDVSVLRVFSRSPSGLLGRIVELGTRDGLQVRDATSMLPSLENVFLTLTGREYRE